MEKIYDVLIIGAGPAGLTAALYAARSGLKIAVISKDIGGVANTIPLLENYPGFKGEGTELMKKFYEQIKGYDVNFIMAEIKNIKKQRDKFIIETGKEKINGKSVIITTGTERKKLNIKGEKELTGRGVSYCVTCDGFLFKGKEVAVIGGSDCAAISALALSDMAKKVFILYRGKKLRCEDISARRLEQKKNVKIVYNIIPLEIKGKEKVEKIIFKENTEKKEIKLDGVFVEIGAVPQIKFAKTLKLRLDKKNYIVIDENMKTSVDGLFAAGDVTDHLLKQVVVASAQGAIAAKSAYHYLNNFK